MDEGLREIFSRDTRLTPSLNYRMHPRPKCPPLLDGRMRQGDPLTYL